MKNPAPYILSIFVTLALGFALGFSSKTEQPSPPSCKTDTVIIYQASVQAPGTEAETDQQIEKFTVVKAPSGTYYVKSSWTGVVKIPMRSRAEAEEAAKYLRRFYRDLEEIKQMEK